MSRELTYDELEAELADAYARNDQLRRLLNELHHAADMYQADVRPILLTSQSVGAVHRHARRRELHARLRVALRKAHRVLNS